MKKTIPIFFILGLLVMATPSLAAEQWFFLEDIGQHLDSRGVTLVPLSRQQAKELFKKETGLQEKALHQYEKIRDQRLKDFSKTYRHQFQNDKTFHIDKNNLVSASVYAFSKSKAKIHIKFVYGHSRWHHFYIALADFITERDPFLDGVFGLNELEKQYAFSFKGVCHGMPFAEVEEKLGKEFFNYAGQSPQYQNIYYEQYNLEIIIQDWKVKCLRKGKPGWMDTAMKFKNEP
jgi:hypothetical protein